MCIRDRYIQMCLGGQLLLSNVVIPHLGYENTLIYVLCGMEALALILALIFPEHSFEYSKRKPKKDGTPPAAKEDVKVLTVDKVDKQLDKQLDLNICSQSFLLFIVQSIAILCLVIFMRGSHYYITVQ
eukprot:TRINITY_DN9169_c0_g1_i1.p1 TRINITY_DN9169_c0_g1~~TRINITY_DN9169_c0_g1_i1.p1  ORF type:complete len:148 (+),score=23.22 TRINITY_DN9169_c0_g1_i1:61-444(+)